MWLETRRLTGKALDFAVAKAKGMTAGTPKRATYDDVKDLPLPFTLYGIVSTTNTAEGVTVWSVEEITVTRCGVKPGCQLPSIDFKDSYGSCSGSIEDFYATADAANLAATLENAGGDYYAGDPWYSPTTNDEQMLRLLREGKFTLSYWITNNLWLAQVNRQCTPLVPNLMAPYAEFRQGDQVGTSINEAVCRAYVGWKLGESVEVQVGDLR